MAVIQAPPEQLAATARASQFPTVNMVRLRIVLCISLLFVATQATLLGANPQVYMWTTIAGPSSIGSADGIGDTARFDFPWGVATDTNGNVFVADRYNHTIRKVTLGGQVTTLAGQAGSGGSADGTNGKARFYYPSGVAVDTVGNVLVADTYNHVIRKIAPSGAVGTVAGMAGA